ncbi:minor capsid protein [Streptococcus ruminantium]|nr:minor capsid protein [Streptococcus ruminantium]
MKNLDYWKKRKAQRMVQEMDKAERVSKKFDEIYDLASRQITSKIDQIVESYRRNHGLSEIEAKQILSQADSLNIQDLKRALQNTTDSEEIRQILTLLDSAPYASRIERYETLRRQVDDLSTRLFKAENGASRAFYDEYIPDTYYHSIFDLQQQSGVAFAFNKIDPEEIREIQRQPWLGANYSQRIWGNTQQLADELKKELAVSLLTGRSAHETADFINSIFNKGKNNARRLVRTEANHFHAEMEAKAYEEADVEYYRFLATLDLRTSSVCRAHDGKIYKVRERKTGVNYPPLHPWCRSDTIAMDDEEWLVRATRSARDPATGKTIQVPANMTYKEWYAKHVEKPKKQKVSDAAIKPKTNDVLFRERLPRKAEKQVGKVFPFFNRSVITLRQERLEHILEGHADIGADVSDSVRQVIKKPDKVLVDHKNKDSLLVIGKGIESNVNVAVRLSSDERDNSVITAMRVSDKTIRRILRKNKKIYDKNE